MISTCQYNKNNTLCNIPKQFFSDSLVENKNNDDVNKIKIHININLIVWSHIGIIDALIQIANHPSAKTVIVYAFFSWDDTQTTSKPKPHIFFDNKISPLNNYDSIVQNQKIRVIGFMIYDDVPYIISTDIYGDTYIIYNVVNTLNSLFVFRIDENKNKISENIYIGFGGSNNIDATTKFFNT